MRRAILIDFDHTISDGFWRDQMLATGSTWDELHAASAKDKPLSDIAAIVAGMHLLGYRTIGCTGRPEKFRQMSIGWAAQHEIPICDMIMRPDEDRSPSGKMKLAQAIEHFGSLEALREHVAFIMDDRQDVIEAFQAIGVPAIQVFARGLPHAQP